MYKEMYKELYKDIFNVKFLVIFRILLYKNIRATKLAVHCGKRL